MANRYLPPCRRKACLANEREALRLAPLRSQVAELRQAINAMRLAAGDEEFALRQKIKALEAAQTSIRAEHQRELEALRVKARELQDALTHAHHEKAGAEGRAFQRGLKIEALTTQIAHLHGHREQILKSNAGLRDRVDALRDDLQAVLDAQATATAVPTERREVDRALQSPLARRLDDVRHAWSRANRALRPVRPSRLLVTEADGPKLLKAAVPQWIKAHMARAGGIPEKVSSDSRLR